MVMNQAGLIKQREIHCDIHPTGIFWARIIQWKEHTQSHVV